MYMKTQCYALGITSAVKVQGQHHGCSIVLQTFYCLSADLVKALFLRVSKEKPLSKIDSFHTFTWKNMTMGL